MVIAERLPLVVSPAASEEAARRTYGVRLSCMPNLCLFSERLTVSTAIASVSVEMGEIFCL